MSCVNPYLQCIFNFSAFFGLILEKKRHGAQWIKTGSDQFHTWATANCYTSPTWKKIRDEDPQESNAFGCMITQNKGLNTVPITISHKNCNLSSVSHTRPSSQLPASWKLWWLLIPVQLTKKHWRECRPCPLSTVEAMQQWQGSLHGAENKFRNAAASCSATAPHDRN